MLALLLLACDSPCRPGPDPTLEVGLGADDFTPFVDGDPAQLVYGSQGGYHVDLALRTTHLEGDDLLAGTLEGRIDGEIQLRGTPWFQLDCDASGEFQAATGLRLIVQGPVEDVIGRLVEVTVAIGDSRGTSLDAVRSLTVQGAPE